MDRAKHRSSAIDLSCYLMTFLAFWLVESGVLLLLYSKGYFMLFIEFPGVGKSWLLTGLKIAQFKL